MGAGFTNGTAGCGIKFGKEMKRVNTYSPKWWLNGDVIDLPWYNP